MFAPQNQGKSPTPDNLTLFFLATSCCYSNSCDSVPTLFHNWSVSLSNALSPPQSGNLSHKSFTFLKTNFCSIVALRASGSASERFTLREMVTGQNGSGQNGTDHKM